MDFSREGGPGCAAEKEGQKEKELKDLKTLPPTSSSPTEQQANQRADNKLTTSQASS